MLRPISFLSMLLAGMPACVELPAEPPTGATEQAIIDCTEWQCGSNSPQIATYPFHELNTRGLENAQGFSVIGLRKGSLSYTLSVEGGKIIGRGGAVTLQGLDLKDAQIWVRHLTNTYAIRITDVQTTPMFATLAGQPKQLETYLLDVNELVNGVPTTPGWRNLCHNPPSRDNPDVLGMNTYHSVVFEGERINATAKTIGTVLESSWFNIGCAGHALAKMALSGHTEAARLVQGFATTIPERQAFLKMVSGDYCGTGKPFTVAGQPLQWMDAHGYTKYMLPAGSLALEARWTPTGAACLNTPRVNANPTPLGTTVFNGAVVGAIAAECPLPPSCAGGVASFNGAYLLSANPL
ncbi:MAG TPA: ADYC domain-containing protein [Kofleriaceae bacterium]|nr:ADYC domain-containing protein [Kofleriaceae bacterium]